VLRVEGVGLRVSGFGVWGVGMDEGVRNLGFGFGVWI
jgi:hypothetical protein